MASNTTVNFDALETMKDLNSEVNTRDIGVQIVEEIKKLIAAGISPVTGERFDAYKAVNGLRASKKAISKARSDQRKHAESGHLHNFDKAVIAEIEAKSKALSQLQGYPYSVKKKFPDKTITPVNLYLSGKMLEFLITYNNDNQSLKIGISESAPENIKTISEAHNEGPTNDAFPQRRFIPTDDGEEFTISIMRKLLDLYTESLSNILEASK